LGMTDDNLDGNQKFKNWNCGPNEYWKMLAEHNRNMSNNLNDNVDKSLVDASINTIYQILKADLNFGA
jgi:formylmethanofuran:tetrahydromethanopterin formyltransferase